MSRLVIFVEGQAEQIFARELLLRKFNWDKNRLCIRCFKLNAETLESAEYDFGDDDASHYYQIINAGGDNKVLSAMIRRADGLINAGFNRIIGLRDMYSQSYRELSPNIVSDDINRAFKESSEKTIQETGHSDCMKIHFAIMEVETWMLALLEKWKRDLTDDELSQHVNPSTNLETIFHPVQVIKDITTLLGDPYGKHKGQVISILSNIEWDDYYNLYCSNRCPSYNSFLDSILYG